MTNKRILRREILQEMKSQSITQKAKNDNSLYEQLYAHPYYQSANSVALVLSMDHEVDTGPIIEKLLSDNKKIYVPSTNYKKKEMHFQRLLDLESISTDEKGIQYINKQTEKSNEIDLVIVPGVAFREDGFRIGYGGGYFDKYLSTYEGNTLSLVYPFQLRQFTPEEHDIPVQEILLSKEINGENK